jgi:hypothetical protein
MANFIPVKALSGFNFVRADQVIAISAIEPTKCTIMMSGGLSVPCSEAAKEVIAKLEAVEAGVAPPAPNEEIK